MVKIVFLFLSLTFIVACAETKNSSRVASDEYRIAYGETLKIENNEISFLSIIEDNRCPENVQCIWKGRAIIQLEVNGTLKEIYFGETRNQEPKSLVVFSSEKSTVNVFRLEPLVETEKQIDLSDYVVFLKTKSFED